MKTITTQLDAHLQQEVTTLATCWKTTLRDGAVFGFTDHVADLVIGGLTYQASSAYAASAVQTVAGLEVDNLEMLGALDPVAFSDDDVRAGRWDYAAVEIFLVNYTDLTQGTMQLRSGNLGEVNLGKSRFSAELRGISQRLTQNTGRLHLPGCDADLGDARCKVNLGTFTDGTVAGLVTAVTDHRVFTASALTQAAGWFDNGLVRFAAGSNQFFPREVKTYAAGVISLQDAVPFAINVGDSFTITAGCDKQFATCIAKFNNALNFQGFPHLPGIDRMVTGT